METKIALMLGYIDTRDIYKELELRQQIIDKMVEHKIFNYYDVWEIVKNYHYVGKAALPFDL